MSTKIGTLEQHQCLHTHFPNDCCLCRLEKKLAERDAKIKELGEFYIAKTNKLSNEIARLKDTLNGFDYT